MIAMPCAAHLITRRWRKPPSSRLPRARAHPRALLLTRKQATAAQRVDWLLRTTRTPFTRLDLDGRMLAANEACETLSGYAVAELLAMSPSALVVPEQVVDAHNHLLTAVGGGWP